MCGCMKQDLLGAGFSEQQLQLKRDWKYCTDNDALKFIRSDIIITSVAYGYREWAMELCKALEIETYPKSFGLLNC